MSLLERMKNEILIADGAMGTLLYSYGTDCCFEELNISQAEQIQQIHKAYIHAGANLIQTNSYAANYIKLQRYGLEDNVKEINTAAVRNARKAAGKDSYVVGTIGGIRGMKPNMVFLEEIKRSFREQLYCLLLEGVDGILLETYYDIEELENVLQIVRKETELPIIAQVSLHEVGVLQDQTPISKAIERLENLGADVVGLNCRLGPHHMLVTLEDIPLPSRAYLSAYPNASIPAYTDGKFHYEGDPNYFRQSAKAFRNQGVRLIGGCCGTTPDHIQAFASELKGLPPISEKLIKKREQIRISDGNIPVREYTPLEEIVKMRSSVIVELDPPKHLNTAKFFEGVKAFKEIGIDAITLADNSLATPRICNSALGYRVKKEMGMRPLVHITCRDRNIIGLQSHLMGLHTLGLYDVLALTGDPARVGDFPGASSVYDLSSFELIQMIKQFNEGISVSGKHLQEQSVFSVGAAFNPNVRSIEKAVQRLEKKITYGADYFVSQPVFSLEKLLEIHGAVKHLKKPIYIGIMPLTGSKNTEFLHNEVPGIKISEEIRSRMANLKDDPVHAAREGVAIAKSLIDAACELFNGIYLITPFMRFDLTAELALYAHEVSAKITRRNKNAKISIN
ncbi:bifunctional homocysteine S-methyltransferase/methylenetetrahydrofolate reductase [Cytobacillus solani]|uniref:Homocysteine methyltransferase n=1 Tax=Cytobacillus solani TaxID=1637975 RepID=A0A0Q3VHF2_9BACI|nr:bifunctional homocysteine S-methyltransferase/methylenetetrahydrofolate reductase [Cytobacillus solani]KOP82590.1 homocysteine methyltransferase [Bacillus sp. FJAT-21945]KQL19602.1 homocysteine methyltransferase [Cytobacillus solani]USK52829.1 bifunctional homocysteine S-methyltransferase/methylenetetrahydrofolate reductase [Cytobacillus solani]